jgi:hypothetical protein
MRKSKGRAVGLSGMDEVGTADHEAGHAVIAAHLHLPFRDVAIYDEREQVIEKSLPAGELRGLSRSFQVRAYKMRADGNLEKVNLDQKLRQYVEKSIVILWAGRAAAEMLGTANIAGSSGDEKQIRVLQRRFRISDTRVGELHRRAERLVRLQHVKEAIVRTSAQLLTERVVTARQVRDMYREQKRLATYWRASATRLP